MQNMIKDKISCKLKNEIIKNNLKSIHDGLERGFIICIGKDKKLYPHKIKCVGESCKITLRGICPNQMQGNPNQMQGNYHVHTLVQQTIFDTEEATGKKLSEEEVIKFLSKSKMKDVLKHTMPSKYDLENAILNWHEKISRGTECIGTDFRPNIINCLTVNPDAETLGGIEQLFDKENIDLRKIKCTIEEIK